MGSEVNLQTDMAHADRVLSSSVPSTISGPSAGGLEIITVLLTGSGGAAMLSPGLHAVKQLAQEYGHRLLIRACVRSSAEVEVLRYVIHGAADV